MGFEFLDYKLAAAVLSVFPRLSLSTQIRTHAPTTITTVNPEQSIGSHLYFDLSDKAQVSRASHNFVFKKLKIAIMLILMFGIDIQYILLVRG